MKNIRMRLFSIVILLFTLLSFTSAFSAKNHAKLHGRVPVPVQVTVSNQSWVETISICNTSPNAIPLGDIEFDFNYSAPMPTNIWGSPWVGWHLAQQTAGAVVLLGASPNVPPQTLPSDPNCQKPMTIQFNASPTLPAPTGPFVFKAAGAVPSGSGNMVISLPAAPASGLSNPQVTVQGAGTTQQQSVSWGSQWQLSNLVPGSYTVTAAPVNNGTDYFEAAQQTVTVADNATTPVTVQYIAVPSGQVTVNLVNAPSDQALVNFIGKKYTLQKTVANGSTVQLPADTYNVSSSIAGYTITITPNPLVVPDNSNLTLTYDPIVINTNSRFVAFFQSSVPDVQTTDGTRTTLANLPAYANVVNLAFMRPDASYVKGSFDISGTGLQFNYAGTVLKQALDKLHAQNPNTKVLVSIGGSTYLNWGSLNAQAISDFVADFGLDGIDINFQPSAAGCALGTDNHVHCLTDTAFASMVDTLRAALPRPYWLTITTSGVGAYGEDRWKNASPVNQSTGIMLPLLHSSSANAIDMINIMSYDLGNTYLPNQALSAFANYFSGPLSLGVEVPPEAAGTNVYTVCKVLQLAQAVKTVAAQRNMPQAFMLWSIQKTPTGTPSATNPNAQMLATTICNALSLANCDQPLLVNTFSAKNRLSNVICK